MTLDPIARSVRLCLDASEFVSALTALASEIPQCAPEVVDRALGVCDATFETVVLHVDLRATAAADEVVIRLKPSDGLRVLVAAAGARDFDRLVVEKTGHGALLGAGAMTP
jgi:hypothetical protein